MGSVEESTIAQWSDRVRERGCFWTLDPVVGKRVDKIIEAGFPFDRKDGLIFCRLGSIDDEVSGPLVDRRVGLASSCE